MIRRAWRLLADRRGTTAVEFALISTVLLPMLFGTIELGMLMWTRNALQSTAELTARCVALGSTQCTDGTSYAVNMASNWIINGIIKDSDVTVTPAATSCNGTTGAFTTVSIKSSFWGGNLLPAPFNASTINVSACYPD